MNILIYRWNSYNYIDIIATFQSMEHQVDVIEQELESYDEDESLQHVYMASCSRKTMTLSLR